MTHSTVYIPQSTTDTKTRQERRFFRKKRAKSREKDNTKKSGIYRLECDDCDAEYIGLTKRSLEVREAEHRADCKKPPDLKSAMALHCITNQHSIKDGIQLLKEVNEPGKLYIWESLKLFERRNQNLANIFKEGNSPSMLFECLI